MMMRRLLCRGKSKVNDNLIFIDSQILSARSGAAFTTYGWYRRDVNYSGEHIKELNRPRGCDAVKIGVESHMLFAKLTC